MAAERIVVFKYTSIFCQSKFCNWKWQFYTVESFC